MLDGVRSAAAAILFYTAKKLDYINYKLNRLGSELKRHQNSATLGRLKDIAADVDKFKSEPESAAAKLAEENKDLADVITLYFMVKQAVALYEARINYLPVQIFNEMRNALDHYARALVNFSQNKPYENNKQYHIDKMSGHLQRALLDVIKLTCADMVVEIERSHSRASAKVLGIVNNGEYIREITKRLIDAEQCLVDAKLSEHRLGSGGDGVVTEKYLSALAAHSVAFEYYKENVSNLHWGRAKVSLLVGSTAVFTLVVTLFGRVAWEGVQDWGVIKLFIEKIKHLSV